MIFIKTISFLGMDYLKAIYDEFYSCVKGTIERMGKEDTYRPFHEALLSKEAIIWSRFERSFSTSFGQKSIENISKYAVLSNGATKAERQHETQIELTDAQIAAIDSEIQMARNKHFSNWETSLNRVNGADKTGIKKRERVISDLWWIKDGVNNYVSIKTVKPNIDQTAVAKTDLLKLKINDANCNVYYGLYYNPYGVNKSDYNHNPPKLIFDMVKDPVVLIGKDYWDTLGGSGFYERILKIANEVGKESKKLVESYALSLDNVY